MKKKLSLLMMSFLGIVSFVFAAAFEPTNETETIELTKVNIEAADYISVNPTDKWATNKTYGGISGDFFNMSKGREMTINVKGVSKFEVFVQNSNAGRTYTIAVGSGNAKTITHAGGGVESSGEIETGTTDEVTIKIAGGAEGSVYPVKIILTKASGSSEAVDATFSLTKSSINTAQASQIIVNNKSGLDGLTMEGLTYDDNIISIDETGKITPKAVGTSSIKFTTAAVDGKYNAGSADLSITVTALTLDTQVDVTESATWDWSKFGTNDIKFTADTKPAKEEEFVLSNVVNYGYCESIGTDFGNAQQLSVAGEYAVRDGKYFQGSKIMFKTKVAGKLSVTYSNTGNRTEEAQRRYLNINGTNYGEGTMKSNETVTTSDITVAAGEVVISGRMGTDTENPQYLRYYKIVFTADEGTGGGDEPTSTFRDIKADLTQLQSLATGSDVYIKVAEDGTISEAASAEEANATLKGNWHSSNYGWSNFTASVPVQGCVKITYATHDFGNDIVVTNTAGTEVAKFNTKGAKWESDHNNVVVAYYRTNEATTLNFSKANYNPYFAVEAIDPADLPAEVTNYNITFAAGEGTGTAPQALEIAAGEKFNAPKNYTLYAEGKTLTGWSDGTKTYAIGEEITPEADMTLTAQYTANEVTLADRTEAVTLSFPLNGYNDNPKYNFNGNAGIIVTQATVNGKTIDVKADVDATGGKFAYNGSGWHQVITGTKVTVPSCKDATFAVTTYDNAASVNFNGAAGTADGNTAKFTTTANDATLEISQVSNNYWNALTVTLPVTSGEEPAGTFRDIKVNLTDASWADKISTGGAPSTVNMTVKDDGTTVIAEDGDPVAATLIGYWHGTTYGWQKFKADVPVEGYVKITYGANDYGCDITVTNDEGETVASLNNKNTTGKWSATNPDQLTVTAYYASDKATTLHFSECTYVGYFAVEKMTADEIAELNSKFNVTYYNTDGTELGKQEVQSNKPIGEFKYGVADVTVAEGKAFRGWFATAEGGKKYKETDIVTADLNLYAVATKIEVADNSSIYNYALSDQYFYMEDHECIESVGSGYWHDGTHGWAFAKGDKLNLKVGGDAKIIVGSCFYSDGNDITVTDAGGTEVAKVSDKSSEQSKDGEEHEFEYVGEATTLTLTFAGTAYVHKISIQNHSKNPDAGFVAEKELYATDFTEWTEVDRKSNNETPTTNTVKTKWSHENLTFTLCGVGAYPKGESNGIGKGYNHYIMSAKYTSEVSTTEPYVETTTLASVTKIRFYQFATGSNRGWKILAKGDGDNDWEVVYNTPIAKQAGEEVNVTINKTNCQLRFVNFNNSYNAYMTELHIYGSVDLTDTPLLGSFKANGDTYVAEDLFDEDDKGNLVGEIEIPSSAPMISADNPLEDIVVENGTLGDVTYAASTVDPTETVVTIKVVKGDNTTTYLVNAVWKPLFTITYYDVNGEVIDTQQAEKDAKIGELNSGENVTVAEGSKFRGWCFSKDGGEKATTETLVTGDLALYALVTDIEGDDPHERNAYNLKDKFFYVEDHEAFVPTSAYSYDGSQHGLNIKAGSIKLKVSGNATILIETCNKNKSTMMLKDSKGNKIGTVEIPATDGTVNQLKYTGEADELELSFADEIFLHSLTIINTGNGDITKNEQGYYVAEAGSADSFWNILDLIKLNEDGTQPVIIFLPDGTYDLGKSVEIEIPINNLSIVGQSMENTIIVTTPDVSKEGLGSADLFYNKKNNLYLQDLTLQNALDYYNAGSAGRAAVLQDAGNHTVGKNVRMLSYQDTYYSQNSSQKAYWEGCDIHGTVDFICGGGDIRFQNTTISLEKRQVSTDPDKDGKGSRTIVAPTTNTNFGYVFDGCTIVDLAEGKGDWNFGRTWQNQPITVYLNTTLDDNAKASIISKRWIEKGMNNTDPKVFGEFGTKDASGTDITPTSNKITSYGGQFETILTAEQAANYSFDKMFADWNPAVLAAQAEAPEATYVNGNVTWGAAANTSRTATSSEPTAYAIFKNGELVSGILGTDVTSYAIDIDTETDILEIRAANGRGGFGEAKKVTIATGIEKVKADIDENAVIYNLSGHRVAKANKGVYIIDGKKVIIK